MFGNSGYTGYSASDITRLYEGLHTSFDQIVTTVAGVVQTKVIDPIGEFWYAVEAQQTGDLIINVVNEGFSKALQDSFREITSYFEQTAVTWAQITQNDPVVNSTGDYVGVFHLNRDTIKESYFYDGDEFIGINEDKVPIYMADIVNAKTLIEDKINESGLNLRRLNPFVGHQQEEALQALITKLLSMVNDMFTYFIDGSGSFSSPDVEFRGIQNAAQSWVDKYGQNASAAVQAMQG